MSTFLRRSCWFFLLPSVFIIIGLSTPTVEATGRWRPPTKHPLFVFGDSYVDDGNLPETGFSFQNPYGLTRPGYPTGRLSDGRVLSDFIARELSVKPPAPFKKLPLLSTIAPSSIANGLNFAEGGSGVFPVTFMSVDNLTVQVQHFQLVLAAGLYSSSQIATSHALISISGNDYDAVLISQDAGNLSNLAPYIASVINQAAEDISLLYTAGVRKFIILNIDPLACVPLITRANNFTACIRAFDNLALLQEAIERLKSTLPASAFLILDQFKSFGTILADLTGFGFSDTLVPCCLPIGNGSCGTVDAQRKPTFTLCRQPKKRIFWDIIHPTDAGWKAVTALYIRGTNFTQTSPNLRDFIAS